MRARRGFPRLSAIACASLVLLAACNTDNLRFTADDRIELLTPRARETVALPVTVSWQVTEALPAGAHFGVFVDRHPMGPGRDMRSVVDERCKRSPGCPSKEYLEANGVYTTTEPILQLATLPDTNEGRHGQATETHRIVVVYLDEQDRRIGESAYQREFYLRRDGS